jgi:hypothetical protein
LVVEPDAEEDVQGYPPRQTTSHAANVVGPLPVKAEVVEEFVVNALDDLMVASNPPPQALGPGSAAVALGRMDDLCPISINLAR